LQQVVPYDSSSVQLLVKGTDSGAQRDELQIVGGRGFENLSELMGVSFPIGGDNPNSEVVRTGASFVVEDAPARYEGFRRPPHAQTEIRSWLGVPMLIGRRLIGMIALDKREPGFYTPEHARLAEAFAAQAAIAIENARLYEQAQRDAETRAMLLREVNHRVKNNLTSIMGFLAMETDDPVRKGTDLQLLHELRGRIQGLVTVHDLLSEVQWAPLPIDELVEKVIRAALSGSPIQHRIEVNVTAPGTVEGSGMAKLVAVAPQQATGLAIVVNEFTTNSIKHAFRDRERGRIDVRIDVGDADEQVGTAGSREVTLAFHDDGPGWPEDVLRGERESAGLSIVRATVRSPLLGRLVLENGDLHSTHGGAIAELTFRLVPAG
jgi:two-component sensor histidine kinase